MPALLYARRAKGLPQTVHVGKASSFATRLYLFKQSTDKALPSNDAIKTIETIGKMVRAFMMFE